MLAVALAVAPFYARKASTCKHGYNVNVSGKLLRMANKAIGNATRCLHEVLGSQWKVIIEAGFRFKGKSKP